MDLTLLLQSAETAWNAKHEPCTAIFIEITADRSGWKMFKPHQLVSYVDSSLGHQEPRISTWRFRAQQSAAAS
jgi:hypothetical protein